MGGSSYFFKATTFFSYSLRSNILLFKRSFFSLEETGAYLTLLGYIYEAGIGAYC